MATPAHCLYCFEVLASHLEDHDALNLSQVEQLWSEYITQHDAADPNDNDNGNDNNGDVDMEDDAAEVTSNHLARPPKHSLLNLHSPTTPSSSSSSSTPSTRPDSSLSMSSSRTSLSSAPSQSTLAARLRPRKVERYPAFVTWNTLHRSGAKNLRGCIGTFDAQPIDDVLRSYALTSAFDDNRFAPITAAELPTLDCGVTLLTDFETIPDPMDWELGKHGLRINFTYHGKRLGSTYLPDVPREQGWSKNETMVSLMRKAGWSGRRDEWMDVGDLKVTRYQGSKEGVSYDEWKRWREWVAARRRKA